MIQGIHIIEPKQTINHETKKEYIFEIGVEDYLDRVFDNLPSNSLINKGRCGIGGTYMELKAERNSIIIVPTNGIIDNKCYDEKGVLKDAFYVVRGKLKNFDKEALFTFMSDETKHKKIFCTPESFFKIMLCGFPISELYCEWFVLIDESHAVITDNYRKDMLKVFENVFDFHHICFISATPYKFSSPKLDRFNEYKIGFNDIVGTVHVYSTIYVHELLFLLLLNSGKFPGRVHIFLNSVKQIAWILKKLEANDCSIFCKEDTENMKTLDEFRGYFRDRPQEDFFSKLNFYTSKYFEDWDLIDKNATIIIVSDVHNITLRTGVSNKCIQAAGRNRKKSNQIIHITNNNDIDEFKPFNLVNRNNKLTAGSAIICQNNHIKECKENATLPDKDIVDAMDKYADIDEISHMANENTFKIDRLVNTDFCNQEYNKPEYIRNAWQNGGFKAILLDKGLPVLPNYDKRQNVSHKIKITAIFLKSLEQIDKAEFGHYKDYEKFLPIEFNYVRDIYNELGWEKMEELNFNLKSIRAAYRSSKNAKSYVLIMDEYFEIFKNEFHTSGQLQNVLGDLYVKYGVLDAKSTKDVILNPKPGQLKSLYTKFISTKKDGVNGYRIDKF
ncbi:MAG: hypothetical protein EOP00_21340 [Pedobacter sp.]|nr:MAG: hypothetical protein EOP00_21340 [Pedobacter sp.]